MADWAGTLGILAAAAAVALAWGRLLWYCNERSGAFRRALFFVISLSHARPPAVQSLVLGAIYYAFGFLATALFAVVYRVPVAQLFSWTRLSWPLVGTGNRRRTLYLRPFDRSRLSDDRPQPGAGV